MPSTRRFLRLGFHQPVCVAQIPPNAIFAGNLLRRQGSRAFHRGYRILVAALEHEEGSEIGKPDGRRVQLRGSTHHALGLGVIAFLEQDRPEVHVSFVVVRGDIDYFTEVCLGLGQIGPDVGVVASGIPVSPPVAWPLPDCLSIDRFGVRVSALASVEQSKLSIGRGIVGILLQGGL